MATIRLGGMGMPDEVLRSVELMWRKRKTNRADWGNYGYKLYRFEAINGNIFWGLNLWKLNRQGIYKSTDIASIRKIELNDEGLLIRLYGRPAVQIFRAGARHG